jgi:NADPH-dependent 2,4-dienoyl-CoA reductase/sulfur reductase-like enzyme/pSer/pThr/pTyr-binding forkhead associated (FHA) protein
MTGRRYAIVGDGAAGMTAAQNLRRIDAAASITVISDDPNPTYFRAALTNYLLGELRDEQIWAVPPTLYRDLRIARLFGRVASVDPAASRLTLTSGAVLPYESLLIASGSRARPASFAGADLAGVMTLRTLRDARAILDAIALGGLKRAVVIGGGPLALEWAHALHERGVAVTVLLRDGRLMAGAIDATASDLVLARLRMGGIEVVAGDEVEAAIAGPSGGVAGVLTRSGRSIPCELVAVAIGVVCNTELCAGSGLSLGRRGGVAVNDRLRASAPNVYAAGDVAEIDGKLLQLWEPAQRAAAVAAENMAGGDAAYAPGPHYFATRLFDLDYAGTGAVDAAAGLEVVVDHPRHTGQIAYRKLIFEGNRLVGALMLGDRASRVRQRGRLYQRLVHLGADVSSIRGDLLDPAFNLRGWIETRALVAKAHTPEAGGRSPAVVRGTQRIAIEDLASARAPARAGAPAPVVPVGPMSPTIKASPMLSIGLRMPETALALASAATAWLEGIGKTFPLDHETIGIGRLPPAQVVLADREVSSLHAQLTRDDAGWFLRDVGSRNGTSVNGVQITDAHLLREGDRIRVGTTELAFHSTVAASPPGPRLETPVPASGAVAHASAPSVEIVRGPGRGLRFVLATTESSAGRDPTNVIRLDDSSVSRRHAIFAGFGGRWFVSDLHSSRGTLRNGARLAPGEETELSDGDTLTLGDVELRFTHR